MVLWPPWTLCGTTPESFYISKSSLMLLEVWMSWCVENRNALGRLLFIGVWGWVSDMWWNLIGDTFHSIISPLMSSLTRAGLLMWSPTCAGLIMSSLTRAGRPTSLLTCGNVWLVFACILCLYFNDTWQISVGFWVVIAKPSSSAWRFVICCILWTW